MEPEYKAIIDQRRALLVGRVVWTKKFCEKLRKLAILPRALLDEIERDLNHGNRTYVLLARLVARRDPTAFRRFCDVLTSTGLAALAKLLLQDLDNVIWDFDAGQRVKSIEDYVNIINESLLQRLSNMEDPYIRAVLTDEVRRRVTSISRFLLDEIREHEQLRMTMLGHIGKSDIELDVDTVRSDLKNRPDLLFDDAIENTRKKNRLTSQYLERHIHDLEDENQHLMTSLTEQKQLLAECQKKVGELEKAAQAKGDASFLYLQKVIMDQDDNIAKLRGSIKSFKDFISVPRSDITELLSSIRTACPRARSLPMPRFTDTLADVTNMPPNNATVSNTLRRHVKALLDLIEQHKHRGQQASTKIAELERERGTMRTLLNARGATALPAVLSQQLKTFRQQKFEMNDTIQELRTRLREADVTREEMQKKLEELSRIVDPDLTGAGDDGTATANHRGKVRKRSARGRRGSKRGVAVAPSDEKVDQLGGKLTGGDMSVAGGVDTDSVRLTVRKQTHETSIESTRALIAQPTRQTLISAQVHMQTNVADVCKTTS